MSKPSRRVIRSTGAQIRTLVDYMSANTSFAKGENGGPLHSRQTEDEWLKLKQILKEYGPDKAIGRWKSTWRDLKRRAREEVARTTRASVSTGNGDGTPILSDLSSKILNSIGYECLIVTGEEESSARHQNDSQKSIQEPIHEDDEDDDDDNDDDDDTSSEQEPDTVPRKATPTQKTNLKKIHLQQKLKPFQSRIYNPPRPQDTRRKMDQAHNFLKMTHSQKYKDEDDECDLFTRFLAKKLRKLTEERRDFIMYKINNLLYEECHQSNSSGNVIASHNPIYIVP